MLPPADRSYSVLGRAGTDHPIRNLSIRDPVLIQREVIIGKIPITAYATGELTRTIIPIFPHVPVEISDTEEPEDNVDLELSHLILRISTAVHHMRPRLSISDMNLTPLAAISSFKPTSVETYASGFCGE